MENEHRVNLPFLVDELLKNSERVKFGEVVLSLKIHDSRIVAVTHSVTSNEIEKTFNIGDQNGK